MDNRKLTSKILLEEFNWNSFNRKNKNQPAHINNQKDCVNGKFPYKKLLFDEVNKYFYDEEDSMQRYKYDYCIEYYCFKKDDIDISGFSFIYENDKNIKTELYLNDKLTEITVNEYIKT